MHVFFTTKITEGTEGGGSNPLSCLRLDKFNSVGSVVSKKDVGLEILSY